MLASDIAQWVSAFTPIVLLVLFPLFRWAIRSALRAEVENFVEPKLHMIERRIDEHMTREENESRHLTDKLTGIESRLSVIESRSSQRRAEDP